MVIGMKRLIVCLVIFLFVQNVNAETVSDGNMTISIDIPEYVSQNETFLINLSAVDISAYPYAGGYIFLDEVFMLRQDIFFYTSDVWNRTINSSNVLNMTIIFNGGVGGIEWNLPSDAQYSAGQTIPLKFRAQKVTHTMDFDVRYYIEGCYHRCGLQVISAQETVTTLPVFDPSVQVTVSNSTAIVFQAISGKGVDYVRFSEGNQQYIINWDSSGNPAGEYNVQAGFSNGYVSQTKILLQ